MLLQRLFQLSAIRPLIHRQVPVRTCLTYDSGGAYEGDGKTSVTLLNREVEDLLLIDSYSTHGFRINNGLFVCGPVALFPRTILSWDVAGPEDVSVPSLTLFWLLEPKPDVLLIGVGDRGQEISEEVRIFMHKKKISLEVLETSQACAAFNFMNSDGRNVAAALIPNQTLALSTTADLIESANVKGRLFHSSGSSLSVVEELSQALRTQRTWKNYEEICEGKYKPWIEADERDRVEMEKRGLIPPKGRQKFMVIDPTKKTEEMPDNKSSETKKDQDK